MTIAAAHQRHLAQNTIYIAPAVASPEGQGQLKLERLSISALSKTWLSLFWARTSVVILLQKPEV